MSHRPAQDGMPAPVERVTATWDNVATTEGLIWKTPPALLPLMVTPAAGPVIVIGAAEFVS